MCARANRLNFDLLILAAKRFFCCLAVGEGFVLGVGIARDLGGALVPAIKDAGLAALPDDVEFPLACHIRLTCAQLIGGPHSI